MRLVGSGATSATQDFSTRTGSRIVTSQMGDEVLVFVWGANSQPEHSDEGLRVTKYV